MCLPISRAFLPSPTQHSKAWIVCMFTCLHVYMFTCLHVYVSARCCRLMACSGVWMRFRFSSEHAKVSNREHKRKRHGEALNTVERGC